MKKMSVALLSAAILSAISLSADACTGLIVGKGASTDGSIIIARNEDFGVNNWNKHMVYHPAQKNQGGEWHLGNGLVVPMPVQFYGYSAMPDWDAGTVTPSGRYYEERGINQFNVAVSATTSAESNKKAQEADPLVKNGVIEAVIPTLILPQATSAREGVALLGHYVEQYGAGEANSLYIADTKEVWLVEIGSGHQWIAVKVPDNSYAIMANGLRVHGVNLNSDNVMHAKGLFEFVKEHNLLQNPDTKSFNFAKAFGVVGDIYNTDREWLGQSILTPSSDQAVRQQQYPLFMKPDQKISVADVADVLGATFKGTVLEKTGQRPMRVDRQLESHIIQLRPYMEKPFQGLIWQSFGVLPESVLMPIYTTLHQYPAAYSTGTDQYSDNSAYWQFRSLTTLAETNPDRYMPVIKNTWDKQESELYKQVSAMDKMLNQTYKTEPATAKEMAADFSYGQLNKMLSTATQLRYKMMTDLTKHTEKKYSPEEFKKIMSL